jgi:hypothetical protein
MKVRDLMLSDVPTASRDESASNFWPQGVRALARALHLGADSAFGGPA